MFGYSLPLRSSHTLRQDSRSFLPAARRPLPASPRINEWEEHSHRTASALLAGNPTAAQGTARSALASGREARRRESLSPSQSHRTKCCINPQGWVSPQKGSESALLAPRVVAAQSRLLAEPLPIRPQHSCELQADVSSADVSCVCPQVVPPCFSIGTSISLDAKDPRALSVCSSAKQSPFYE